MPRARTHTQTVSLHEFQQLVDPRHGMQNVQLYAVTEPRLPMRCPYHGVRHHIVAQGVINLSYAFAVNNQRRVEGLPADFRPQPRTWGTRVMGPLIEHRGAYYLEVIVTRVLEEQYRQHRREIPFEELRPWFPQRTTRQGVEHPVIYRNFKIEHIRWVELGTTRYRIQER